MLDAWHLNAGAARGTDLTLDARDRRALVRALVGVVGARLLAYCVMRTHVHVVAEGTEGATKALVEEALRIYARAFNGWHGFEGRLRGPVGGNQAPGDRELAEQIRYTHENPIKVNPAFREVEHEIAWPWSSAAAFGGLSRAPFPNVARARELMGRWAYRALPDWRPPLAGLEPSALPQSSVETILTATARVYGLTSGELRSRARSPWLAAARRVFVAAGRLEGYSDAKLALGLSRARSRITRIALEGPADREAIRMTRTFARTPELWVGARGRKGEVTETVTLEGSRVTRGP